MSKPAPKRERLRFDAFDYECFADGRCQAQVVLEWKDGAQYTGRADGTQTVQGGLRAGALAALRAAEQATEGRLSLELVGVKAVRAFDASVIIVGVRGRSEERSYRLLGSYAAMEEVSPRGAALALLDATNRILEKYLPRSD